MLKPRLSLLDVTRSADESFYTPERRCLSDGQACFHSRKRHVDALYAQLRLHGCARKHENVSAFIQASIPYYIPEASTLAEISHFSTLVLNGWTQHGKPLFAGPGVWTELSGCHDLAVSIRSSLLLAINTAGRLDVYSEKCRPH